VFASRICATLRQGCSKLAIGQWYHESHRGARVEADLGEFMFKVFDRTSHRPTIVCAVVATTFLAATGVAGEKADAPDERSTKIEKVPAGKVDVAPNAATVAAAQAVEQARLHAVAIETAKARCTAVLKSINAVTIAKDPIEDGACGTLAPVELVSVGKNPVVALSPPAILNCDMVVAIHDWIKSDVQPLARKHLGQDIVKIETMSSYSCRNAYGRKLSKLSEHGKANALDVRGFATAKGDTAYVLEDWGMTSGEIRLAAAKAEKEQVAREVAAAASKAQAESQARALAAAKMTIPPTGQASSANPIASASTLMEGLPKPSLSLGQPPNRSPTDFGLAQPNKLGGPKKTHPSKAAPPAPVATAAAVASMPSSVDLRSFFLRSVHGSACKRFATTLGPETNAAHRNHFHVDLADRKSKAICD
jgi:hypothetical protein